MMQTGILSGPLRRCVAPTNGNGCRSHADGPASVRLATPELRLHLAREPEGNGMIALLIIATLAVGHANCPAKTKASVCYHEVNFKCPPGLKWKHTAQGCWDGHRLYVYKYTTKRTSRNIVGSRHRKN